MSLQINKYFTLFLLFFIFFLPRNKFIPYEPYLIWKINKEKPKEAPLDPFHQKFIGQLKKNYFLHNHSVTFFSNSSSILSQYRIPAGFYISCGRGDKGGILYSNNTDKITFLNKHRGIIWETQTYAYPFLTLNNNIIFLITGENGGYGVLDLEGNELAKTISVGMYVTTFDIAHNTNLILVGYADGTIKLYNQNLNEIWFKKFLDSNIQITKKAALSSQGNYSAVLAGLEKEYLYLLNKNGDMILKHTTGDNRNRSIDLVFSADEKYLLEESEKGYRLYSVQSKKCILDKQLFPSSKKRKIISMDVNCNGQFMALAYYGNNETTFIDLYHKRGTLYYRIVLENEIPFISFSFDKNNFLLETEKNIYLYGF